MRAIDRSRPHYSFQRVNVTELKIARPNSKSQDSKSRNRTQKASPSIQPGVVRREREKSQRVHGGEQRHQTTYPKHYRISASKYLPTRKRAPHPLLTSVGVDGEHDTIVLCSGMQVFVEHFEIHHTQESLHESRKRCVVKA